MGKRKFEFTKTIVALVMSTYFIGLGIGVYVVLKILLDFPDFSVQALTAMFTYIGVPVASAIGFYCWKAKNENISKHNGQEQQEQTEFENDINEGV